MSLCDGQTALHPGFPNKMTFEKIFYDVTFTEELVNTEV